jgi:hypothetical protein
VVECSRCGAIFVNHKALNRHITQAHPPQKPADALQAEVFLPDCVVLGRYGYEAAPQSVRDLAFAEEDLILVSALEIEWRLPYDDLTNLELSGPGKRTEGGGFVGGGFGLEGFAIGAAAAGLLNALTTRTKVETLIGLQWKGGELILLTSAGTPENLRHRLSWVFGRLRDREPAKADGDPVKKLKELADLLDRGLINQAEFDQMKASLLSDL